MILCANPRAQYTAHQEAIDKAVLAVFANGRYINGPEVEGFEKEFASYTGTAHAVGVANGTDAIRVALGACDIKTGDEVITVSHTAVATVSAIEQTGASAVLVDIDPQHYVIDTDLIESAITPQTRAVVAVHIYGQPVAMGKLLELCRRHDLWLIEDCAQAHGARYGDRKIGSIGDIAAFSFYPTKNLGAIGDGGAVVTNDPQLFQRCKLLREYGWAARYISEIAGANSRLDEVQAAVLRVKLPFLDADNDARRELAAFYRESLADLPVTLPSERPGSRHVYHLFVLRTPQRDLVLKHMASQGVQAAVHYPMPIHLQPAYKGRIKISKDGLPATEKAANEVLSLPLYPELAISEAQRVVAALRSWTW